MSDTITTRTDVGEEPGGPTVPSETSTSADETVTADDAFDLLSNTRRRYTLHYLKRAGPEVELGDLAEQVAAWENGTSPRQLNAAERKRVYTSLQSHHLPKMEKRGIIEYDDRAGIVELTDAAGDLNVHLEIINKGDIPWSQYYLGMSIINALLVTGIAMDLWPFSMGSGAEWAIFIVTTFAISALVHVYYDSKNELGKTEKPPELCER